MIVIGITGPSGAGKSVVSRYLSSRGINVIDADAVYHDVITPPSSCLDELVQYFGKGIISGNGNLNRQALSSLVFGEENCQRLEALNKITHKYVVEDIRNTVSDFRALDLVACVIDAPLLIEAGLCEDCDLVITVLADRDIRAKRISMRDGIDLDAAMRRISSQKDDSFYVAASDAVIRNDGDVFEVEEAIRSLLYERGVALS